MFYEKNSNVLTICYIQKTNKKNLNFLENLLRQMNSITDILVLEKKHRNYLYKFLLSLWINCFVLPLLYLLFVTQLA